MQKFVHLIVENHSFAIRSYAATYFQVFEEILWPLRLENSNIKILQKKKKLEKKLQKLVPFFVIMFALPKHTVYKMAIAGIGISQETSRLKIQVIQRIE